MRTYVSQKDEVTEILHNEELYGLYTTPHIVMVIKSWRIM
jgi:hypothetical protein